MGPALCFVLKILFKWRLCSFTNIKLNFFSSLLLILRFSCTILVLQSEGTIKLRTRVEMWHVKRFYVEVMRAWNVPEKSDRTRAVN